MALVLVPCLTCHAKDKDDKVLCAKLKNELRAKYKLSAKADEAEELEDTRSLVKQLESMLDKKRKDKETASSNESKELAMNRRMEIGNLEYEIENLSDFIPEIKSKKDEGGKASWLGSSSQPRYKMEGRRFPKTYITGPLYWK